MCHSPRAAAIVAGLALATTALAADRGPMLPTTSAPIIYTIDYSGRYFTEPDYIEPFRAAPPDLLHVGKAVPISHHWGPVRLYQGENQYTGGPGHTLSWENIALLSPDALERRIATLRATLRRYHAIGIREITPYISYHTLAGDHESRKGFWAFYDAWETYAKWAGPKPARDPFDWLAVDAAGKFIPGSCGGYSPPYFAPLHRYRACIHHPDWAEWHRRLVRMVAQVGYDGCFVDNAHPDRCFCRHCKALFRSWLAASADVPWVRRLAAGLDVGKLALDSPDAPPELIRRWRVLATGNHLGMLRDAARKVNPRFTIFPNSGRIDECLQVGGQCDRLMFESTFAPGIQAADAPPETDAVAIHVADGPVQPKPLTHRYSLSDATTWMEMEADILLPSKAQTGKPVALEVRIVSVGASLRDEDAAEDFHLVLHDTARGDDLRLALEPKGPIGGSGSSRKPTPPPVTLKATWTPPRPGTYALGFGFRYTDDSHAADTRLRPRLDPLTWGRAVRTHLAELLFAQHMHAKPIYLGYDARRTGSENVQELALAEMAAFGGGGGFSGRGAPQAKYRTFFKKHPDLFDGWTPAAPAAVVYAFWGPNPLNTYRPSALPAVHHRLAETHRPFVALIDHTLPDRPAGLAPFRVVCLASPALEMSAAQLAALEGYVRAGGTLIPADEKTTINGQPIGALFGVRHDQPVRKHGDGKVMLWQWTWHEPLLPTAPIAPTDRGRRPLRFALYRKPGRLALHAVNYSVCLLDKARKILEVPETPLAVPLPAGWQGAKAICYSPDGPPRPLGCRVADGRAALTLPRTRIYRIVLIEKQ